LSGIGRVGPGFQDRTEHDSQGNADAHAHGMEARIARDLPAFATELVEVARFGPDVVYELR
jgi:hypothetical protein